MKQRFVGLLAAGLFAIAFAPSIAVAYPASWEFVGAIGSIDTGGGTSWPADVRVGAPVRVLVSFDTEEQFGRRASSPDPVTGAPRTGWRYGSNGTPSLQIALYLGTLCRPCVPTNDVAATPNNLVLVRDSWQNEAVNGRPGAFDGYTFSTTSAENYGFSVIVRDLDTAFNPQVVAYAGGPPFKPLPVVPDSRMTSMSTSIFEICDYGTGDCVHVPLTSVSVPTYGTYFIFTGRHCQYPDVTTNINAASYGDDCVVAGGQQALTQISGGTAGWGDFAFSGTLQWPQPGNPAILDTLGTGYSEIAFGGPGGMPVLRGSSLPTDIGRTNANLLAYQQYTFGGTQPTPLALVSDLGYSIMSNWTNSQRPNDTPIQVGQRAGGANIATVLSVIDAAKIPPEAMAAVHTFNTIQCGGEADLLMPNGSAWPAGSILAAAVYSSPELEQGSHTSTLRVLACNPDGSTGTQPATVTPGQTFYLAASMQTPARGRWSQAGYTVPAANGFLDAANTLRAIPDPEAPPEVLVQLVQGLQPSCSTCAFAPELRIDVKPGSADNSINIGSKGVIPVAILGSDRFDVRDIAPATLRLGLLAVRTQKGGAVQCAIEDVNGDSYPDLVCQFQNDAASWTTRQSIVTLSGKLVNGETIFASDTVRLVP